MSIAEAVAFTRALARGEGIAYDVPNDSRVWARLSTVVFNYLTDAQIARYLEELGRRRDAGEPLVREGDYWPRPPKTSSRKKARAPRRKLPGTADALSRGQEEVRRREARVAHEANRHTARYRTLRAARLKLAGNRCERCGKQPQESLQLHHLHYETLSFERIEDVRMFCDECHLAETERQRALRRAQWRPPGPRRPTKPF